MAGFIAIALSGPINYLNRRKVPRPLAIATEPAALSKPSIAVLPFENLSADKENAFFTDGVQDEILTDLARVAGRLIERDRPAEFRSSGRVDDLLRRVAVSKEKLRRDIGLRCDSS